VTFSQGDSSDLTDKIQFSLDNPERLKENALMARQKVLERFSWDTVVDCYDRLIKKTLGFSSVRLTIE
jgi:glycosyltransferase involved in cell wall biosynthesis